jgi:hypothetical protein
MQAAPRIQAVKRYECDNKLTGQLFREYEIRACLLKQPRSSVAVSVPIPARVLAMFGVADRGGGETQLLVRPGCDEGGGVRGREEGSLIADPCLLCSELVACP